MSSILHAPALAPDHLDGLTLLASSIAGRRVAVRVHDAPLAPWSDGIEIHVAPGDGRDVRLDVLVQAALLHAGSLDPVIARRLVGRPALARRYLAVEARRAIAVVAGKLPGRLTRHPALASLDVVSASQEESLALALGREWLPDPDPLLGSIHAGALIRNAKAAAALNAAGAAAESWKKNRSEAALDDEEDAQESKILKMFSSLASGGGPLGDLFKKLLGMGTQPGADETMLAGAGEDLSEGSAGRHPFSGTSFSTASVKTGEPVALGELSTVHRYPEWDDAAGRYNRDWTRVEEFIPWDADNSIDLGHATEPPSREMRRQLARLGLGFDSHAHQQAGEEIVTDDLIRLIVDTRAGKNGDARIYRALQKTRRDLAVLILLDTSSSVKDIAPDGRTIQQQQIALGWQLAATLDGAGDRVALYGFNSWGRERVHMLRVKGFADRLSGETRSRLALLGPAGFTRIGAAVRHAGHVMKAQSGMPFQLVVLITDGLSYDDGYEGRQGEADTRRSIAELKAQHIACLCISVGGDADDAKLRRVFGDAAFMRTDDSAHVARRIGLLFAQAIARVRHR